MASTLELCSEPFHYGTPHIYAMMLLTDQEINLIIGAPRPQWRNLPQNLPGAVVPAGGAVPQYVLPELITAAAPPVRISDVHELCWHMHEMQNGVTPQSPQLAALRRLSLRFQQLNLNKYLRHPRTANTKEQNQKVWCFLSGVNKRAKKALGNGWPFLIGVNISMGDVLLFLDLCAAAPSHLRRRLKDGHLEFKFAHLSVWMTNVRNQSTVFAHTEHVYRNGLNQARHLGLVSVPQYVLPELTTAAVLPVQKNDVQQICWHMHELQNGVTPQSPQLAALRRWSLRFQQLNLNKYLRHPRTANTKEQNQKVWCFLSGVNKRAKKALGNGWPFLIGVNISMGDVLLFLDLCAAAPSHLRRRLKDGHLEFKFAHLSVWMTNVRNQSTVFAHAEHVYRNGLNQARHLGLNSVPQYVLPELTTAAVLPVQKNDVQQICWDIYLLQNAGGVQSNRLQTLMRKSLSFQQLNLINYVRHPRTANTKEQNQKVWCFLSGVNKRAKKALGNGWPFLIGPTLSMGDVLLYVDLCTTSSSHLRRRLARGGMEFKFPHLSLWMTRVRNRSIVFGQTTDVYRNGLAAGHLNLNCKDGFLVNLGLIVGDVGTLCLQLSFYQRRPSPSVNRNVSSHSRSGSLDGSVYENEALLRHTLQQNQLHHYRHNNNNQQHQSLTCGPRKNQDSPTHSPGLSSSLYNSLNTLLSQAHGKPPLDAGLEYPHFNSSHGFPRPANTPIHSFSSGFSTQQQRTNTDFSPPSERCSVAAWRSGMTDLYEDYPTSASLDPLLTPQAYLSLEGQNGEDGGEENIVYL